MKKVSGAEWVAKNITDATSEKDEVNCIIAFESGYKQCLEDILNDIDVEGADDIYVDMES